jgi:2-polyprenyl-3-methyl-5-hydroxy-6-metoxy-1,4-benzoquinol methylase
MKISKTCCPDCKTPCFEIGQIPSSNVFAGRALDYVLNGEFLYRCENCGLGFRWPQLEKCELDKLYKEGSEINWSESFENRKDWILAQEWINKLIPLGGSILDVGTFDGAFLEPLVSAYKCSGIEIHPIAIKRAVNKGVTIIGKDFSDLRGTYNCITAFDVIEHMPNPSNFIEGCLASLITGGYLVISTGNLDATTFRFMGSRYWYSAIPEHISFLSAKWIHRKSLFHNYEIKEIKFFSHSKSSILKSILELGGNVLYYFLPKFFSWLRRKGFGARDVTLDQNLATFPPSWISSRDHMIFLLRKN